MKMLKKVEPDIPTYHTRAMRRQFQKQVKLLSPPPNSSTCGKTHLQIIDRRNLLRVIMSRNWRTCSPCSRNRRPRPCNWHATSKQRLTRGYIWFFFKELEAIVEDLTAADERRHGVAHLSQFLSISDLMKQVKPRVPEGTNIPLESTVIYAFAPPTMHKKTSQYYNGHVQLKHAVQRRQLRAFHTDAHWCVALYWYLRELAIQNCKKCVFISCEDKTKIDFDEPGALVSSGVSGKRSFIRTTSTLGALDHDVNQKGKFKTIFFSKFLWCACQSWSKWVVLFVMLYQLLRFIFSVSLRKKT